MTRERLLSVPGTGVIETYFDEKLYRVDKEEMEEIARTTILRGETTGFDLSRVGYGHIRCFYNPVRMDLCQAQAGNKRMLDYIVSRQVITRISER